MPATPDEHTSAPPTRPTWAEVAAIIDSHFGPGTRQLATRDAGAYSRASRWIIQLPDGSTAFAKADREDRAEVAFEAGIYLRELGDFHPSARAWLPPTTADRIAVLLTEDLSPARWGVPLLAEDARALRDALGEVGQLAVPADLPPISVTDDLVRPVWREFADDPLPAVRTGLVDEAWLDRSLDDLLEASSRVTPEGSGLVHGDTWRQNWCTAERGAVLVDWTGAVRGNPDLNTAWGECGVRACSGPGGIVLPASHPDHDAWAAWMAGLTMRFLVDDLPRRETAPELWATEVREAHAALEWACNALDLALHQPLPGAVPAGPWQP